MYQVFLEHVGMSISIMLVVIVVCLIPVIIYFYPDSFKDKKLTKKQKSEQLKLKAGGATISNAHYRKI